MKQTLQLTQAEKDKAKENRKKKRAATKDKGSKILDQKRPKLIYSEICLYIICHAPGSVDLQ